MKVIIISGPTATGKTDLSIELALRFGGEIVNFDSLLLYKELEVGTAKPSKDQMELIPHHMIDVRSISEPMNAADYARDAFKIVEGILGSKNPVYLAGGSGFYLQALLKGMFDSPTTPQEILQKSHDLYAEKGIEPFLMILKQNDEKSFLRYHKNDHYRIRRAVEHFWTTGTPLSLAREVKDASNLNLPQPSIHNWQILHIFLDLPKDQHLRFITQRASNMIEKGLIDEVKNLLMRGFTGDEKPLQSIGYKETLQYLQGKYKDLNEYQEQIIIATRQLGKAQRTWFKKDEFKITYHPLDDRLKIFHQVEEFLR